MKKLTALVLSLVCVSGFVSCKNDNEPQRETVSGSGFSIAAFEYKEDNGYKLITSEIHSLYGFDSLMLIPSEMEFDGEWIYRITFNPQEYVDYAEEFVILFGEQCVSINGNTYIADDGVPYSEIINWAAAKYKYFDYELIEE